MVANARVECAPDLLDRFRALVEARWGFDLPREREADLLRRLNGLRAEWSTSGVLPGDSLHAFVEALCRTPLDGAIGEAIVEHLTIGETYFLRHPESFEALEREVLPQLVAERVREPKPLRIWSAGCSTGEEAYSLAIAIDRVLSAFAGPPPCEIAILATDVNRRALEEARAGVYGAWSFRQMPPSVFRTYFIPRGNGRWEVQPALRQFVTFAELNLAGDPFASPVSGAGLFDIILCRNTLMYLSPGRVRAVARALREGLVEGGWLLVSPTDFTDDMRAGFDVEIRAGGILYRKRAQRAQRAPAPPGGRDVGSTAPPAVSGRPAAGWTCKPRHADHPLSFIKPPAGAPRTSDPVLRVPPDASDRVAMSSAREAADAGRLEEAMRLCTAAIEAHPLDPDAYFLFATIQTELRLVPDAVASLRRVLYLAPDFALAHYALALLMQRQAKPALAARHLRSAAGSLQGEPPESIVAGSTDLTAAELLALVRHHLAARHAGGSAA